MATDRERVLEVARQIAESNPLWSKHFFGMAAQMGDEQALTSQFNPDPNRDELAFLAKRAQERLTQAVIASLGVLSLPGGSVLNLEFAEAINKNGAGEIEDAIPLYGLYLPTTESLIPQVVHINVNKAFKATANAVYVSNIKTLPVGFQPTVRELRTQGIDTSARNIGKVTRDFVMTALK